jgi:hypothetical protein
MNLNQYKDDASTQSAQQPQDTADSHDHESFLARIWEKLTHGKSHRNTSGSEDKKP